MIVFAGAGGRGGEGRLTVDGLNIGSTVGGGGSTSLIVDISNAEEVVITNSGGLGEMEVGGPSLNVVPKTGGNSVKGSAYLSGVPKGWVASNYSDTLRDAGLSTPGALLKQWDFDAGVGGPVKKDKLWYFVTARDEGQHRSIPGIYPNLNAGDPTTFLYVPDTTRQTRGAESWQVATIRLTWQATPRNKFNGYWNEQLPCNGAVYSNDVDGCRQQPASGATIGALSFGGLTGTTSPEIGGLPAHDRGPLPAVHLDVAGDQSDPRRDRFWEHARALGSTGYAGEPDAEPGPCHGAVCGGLRRQRRHCRPHLPLGKLVEQLGRRAQLAGIAVARHGSPQPEVRLHRQHLHRRSTGVREQPQSHVSAQQRRAERRDADGAPHRITSADPVRRVLRAGTMDARPADAAGRAALRSLVELFPHPDAAGVELSAVHGDVSGNGRRQGLQGHHAARRLRLRPVRQREDRREGERRQVPRGGQQRRRLLLDDQSDLTPDHLVGSSRLDRRQPELHSGLRSAEHVAPARMRSGQHHVRQGSLHDQRRSERAGWLGSETERLGRRGLGSAAGAAADVGRDQLHAALAQSLRRERQHARDAGGFRHVQRHRAGRFAAARGRRVCRVRAVRRQRQPGRTVQRPRHLHGLPSRGAASVPAL